MKILVTGSQGFIGKNLIHTLDTQGFDIVSYSHTMSDDVLISMLEGADLVVHLAGVNRPNSPEDYKVGNADFTEKLCNLIMDSHRSLPIIFSSSTQVGNGSEYAQSKQEALEVLNAYALKSQSPVIVLNLPNVYGKWSRPNYNSVIATWCYNIARDLEVMISNPDTPLTLVYIDTVCSAISDLIKSIDGYSGLNHYDFDDVDTLKLGEILDIIQGFKASRYDFKVPDLTTPFKKNLYSTYLSYLPKDSFSYPLTMHKDNRGSFTEFLKMGELGQVSVNVSKPGVTKGNHWHHTKNEKFLVVSGQARIDFKSLVAGDKFSYFVSGDSLEVVDIPVGYTHSITNVGDTDMVTLMWANEEFDELKPDTYFKEV